MAKYLGRLSVRYFARVMGGNAIIIFGLYTCFSGESELFARRLWPR